MIAANGHTCIKYRIRCDDKDVLKSKHVYTDYWSRDIL